MKLKRLFLGACLGALMIPAVTPVMANPQIDVIAASINAASINNAVLGADDVISIDKIITTSNKVAAISNKMPAKIEPIASKPKTAPKAAKVVAKGSAKVAKATKPAKVAKAAKVTKNTKAAAQSGKKGERPYNTLIAELAKAHNVPLDLAHAVIHVESNYNANAKGAAGEVGLMQLMPKTARGMGYSGSISALFEPRTNLEYGMRYLAKAHVLGGGDTCRTILKYNAGHGAKRMNPISAKYCSRVKNYLASTKNK